MTLLFLVRHGLTAETGKVLYGRTPGIGLDERGRAQAERLVERLRIVRPTAIYSSPLERCRETIEPLAEACDIEVRLRDELIEMDAGSWTGRSLPGLRRTRHWPVVQREPSAFRFPGGESFIDAHTRAVDGAERIARRHPRGRVVIATHGDIVRMLVGHYAGTSLDAFQRFGADTASVSVVASDGRGGAQLLVLNDTGDLSRFAPAPVTTPGPPTPRKLRG